MWLNIILIKAKSSKFTGMFLATLLLVVVTAPCAKARSKGAEQAAAREAIGILKKACELLWKTATDQIDPCKTRAMAALLDENRLRDNEASRLLVASERDLEVCSKELEGLNPEDSNARSGHVTPPSAIAPSQSAQPNEAAKALMKQACDVVWPIGTPHQLQRCNIRVMAAALTNDNRPRGSVLTSLLMESAQNLQVCTEALEARKAANTSPNPPDEIDR